MTERQGVEIDYCPRCRGVWLDRGELDKIIERSTGHQQQHTSHSNHETRSHYNERHDDFHHHSHKKKKKESFLSDLFDF